ncbi:hypothetical protein [Sandarakinorhabdus sp. DWP1-3-1]|uniref:hypothetical protein n=1 Tax=Sandarakinorhabdus sp. DWP1-3-1 TaxID=2804627 RepID=UPI003CF5E50F
MALAVAFGIDHLGRDAQRYIERSKSQIQAYAQFGNGARFRLEIDDKGPVVADEGSDLRVGLADGRPALGAIAKQGFSARDFGGRRRADGEIRLRLAAAAILPVRGRLRTL